MPKRKKKSVFRKNGGREREGPKKKRMFKTGRVGQEQRKGGRLEASFRHNSGGQFCTRLNVCMSED